MRLLLDTNVLSELRHPQGNVEVKAAISAFDDQDLFLSVITMGELMHGITRLRASKRKNELQAWLMTAEEIYQDRILSINIDVARIWGELSAKALKKGKTVHPADGLIAATALHYGLYLATRNVKDVEPMGVMVFNPWQ